MGGQGARDGNLHLGFMYQHNSMPPGMGRMQPYLRWMRANCRTTGPAADLIDVSLLHGETQSAGSE